MFSSYFFGQFVPKDNAALNYNQIMFEFPYVEDAKSYTLFLTYDSIAQPKSGDFIFKAKENLPIIFVKDLRLGKSYKWYVETTLKSGKINSTESYGTKLQKDEKMMETDAFQLQHDAQVVGNDRLLIFNNNDAQKDVTSKPLSVDIIELPNSLNKSLKVVWNFNLNFDTINSGRVFNYFPITKDLKQNIVILKKGQEKDSYKISIYGKEEELLSQTMTKELLGESKQVIPVKIKLEEGFVIEVKSPKSGKVKRLTYNTLTLSKSV